MQELDAYINKVKHLPPAPKVLPELLTLLSKDNVNTSRIVTLIAYDPSLTAAVLKLCNSVLYSPARPIDDLQDAVTWLGFQEIYRMVAAVLGGRALSPAQKGYGIDRGELWRHSVVSAVAAQLIAKRAGDDDNLVFTAALLHDLGKVILSEALEENYTRLVEETKQNHQSLLEVEKKILGVEHAEVGGRLLSRWKFPESLVSAVWFHHVPKAATPHHRVAAYVYLGNLVAHFMGHSYGHNALAMRGRKEALEILSIEPDQLPHFMIATYDQMSAVDALFKASQ